ncbi:MAG: hypothetical protein ABL889_13815 [Terricaulis sp.]
MSCAAFFLAGSLTPAYADSQFSFRIVGYIPIQCAGGGQSSGSNILINQNCNTEHVVRVTTDPEWSGTITYRGRSIGIAKGGAAEFLFTSVEDGVWPLQFSAKSAPSDVAIQVAPL